MFRRPAPASRPRTLLCAIARDEDAYLHEWVGHHLALGFDRIVIYDNESRRPIQAQSLHPDRVEVRPWPTRAGQAPQLTAYSDSLRRERRRTDWLMFLDIDEFLNLTVHEDVAAFVQAYDAFAAVLVHWRVFGSAGATMQDAAPVTRRFTRAASLDFAANRLVKTIFRPRLARSVAVHCPFLRSGAKLADTEGRVFERAPDDIYPTTFTAAQVNHYFTKSAEEFRAKLARGRADLAEDSPDKFRDQAMFDLYDRNEEEERSILREGWGDGQAERMKAANASA